MTHPLIQDYIEKYAATYSASPARIGYENYVQSFQEAGQALEKALDQTEQFRRIADALEKLVMPNADTHAFLTNLAWEVGKNMGLGFEQGRK